MACPRPSWLAVAVLCVGCAHGDATQPRARASVESDAPLDPAIAALRQDNARLRKRIALLEDRIVRLERTRTSASIEQDAVAIDRDLPVVRLEPPAVAAAEPTRDPEPPPTRARKRGKQSRTLGTLPDSGAPAEMWGDDEPAPAPITEAPTGDSRSYRLVGTRLVELTKANAPKQPDRPARDARGNAVLTEYEAAMALYKAGELGGARKAFQLFARAHPKHDYADNALYWMGEAAYDQQAWDEALAAFTEVVERYGGGNKAPDALLKIGLCYGKLGDAANARDVLSGLVTAYPDARASDIARVRLTELES